MADLRLSSGLDEEPCALTAAFTQVDPTIAATILIVDDAPIKPLAGAVTEPAVTGATRVLSPRSLSFPLNAWRSMPMETSAVPPRIERRRTGDVIRWHLSGQDAEGQPFVAGVYPLLLDETCFFLAVDFDKTGWREDAGAFLEACRRLNLPIALERSRSGRGAHVWFFFEDAFPAALARRLGSHVLTETMEGRPDIGLDSYDRLFPNQDTMPQGGFGNLIALLLQ